MNEIILIQEAKIQHQVIEVGKEVKARIDALNIENQVVTDETLQSIKKLKAELNKEFGEFENQRKAIKKAVSEPYASFENLYKENISAVYEAGISTLGGKIVEFETKLKEEKKDAIIAYFELIKASENLSWLMFEQLGVEITLSKSNKSIKEAIIDKVDGIKSDLALIKTEQYEPEILVEYKKHLSASKAITDVKSRKAQEKNEADRIWLQRTQKRQSMLGSLGFISHELTKTYNYIKNADLCITYAEIENFEDAEFYTKYNELKEKIQPKAEVLQAPKVDTESVNPVTEEKPKEFTAKFEVVGTFEQLTALNNYLKENNLTYKNL